MKVGIVGCGLNSDYHIKFSKAYPNATIVGVADKDEKKARECATKFNINGVYQNVQDLVVSADPDVIHILTPPHTHFAVAKEVIELKRHVLVEKPMTLNAEDAKELFKLAKQNDVKLCTMHNHFFDPCMLKANSLVQSGEVGEVISVESYYGLNTQIDAFRNYPTPNVIPWIYGLPGGVYQDFMAHPLYVLLEYTGKPKEINVMSQSHGVLPQDLPDELKININGEKAMGTVTFSFAAKPHLHFIRIYGTKMIVEIDINTMTTIVHPLSSLPKAAQKATYNLSESWQLFKSTASNVINFLTGKLKPYQGMKILIHRFYDSINEKKEAPVTEEQALFVVETMDEIWKQLNIKELDFSPVASRVNPSLLKYKEKILVTGGTGFLGGRLVDLLTEEGYCVRVLARKLSKIDNLKKAGAEIYYGDVADEESLGKAFEGIDIVVHAAAGTSGNKEDSETATVHGTANILKLGEIHGIKKLIYISSCSVYGVADYKADQVVTEEASLERFPAKRGYYSASKLEAESIVIDEMNRKSFNIVILRPGTIFGPGGDVFTPMIGFSIKNKVFVIIGDGKLELPFTYLDNVVNTIINSIQNKKAENQIFNVVDSEKINKRQYIDKVLKRLYPNSIVLYFPFRLLQIITFAQEVSFRIIGRDPILTRYRLISSQHSIKYDNSKLVEFLSWKQKVSLGDALDMICEYENHKQI